MINPNPRVHLGTIPVKTIERIVDHNGEVPEETCGLVYEWSHDGSVQVSYTNGLLIWTAPESLTVISWSEYHS